MLKNGILAEGGVGGFAVVGDFEGAAGWGVDDFSEWQAECRCDGGIQIGRSDSVLVDGMAGVMLARDTWQRENKVYDTYASIPGIIAPVPTLRDKNLSSSFGALYWLIGLEELMAFDPWLGITLGSESVPLPASLQRLPLGGIPYSVTLTPERLPLQQVINDVFTGLAPRASKHGVWLDNQVAEDFYVTADRRRLEQILINLVDNAIKFNHPGGKVSVKAESDENNHQQIINVRDTGPGIPAEHLPRVFERFYRVDKARSREAGGTGLGLAIVKHLSRAHGGEAYVTSEVGGGSEFSVKLPQQPPTVAAVQTIPVSLETTSYAAKL